MRKLKLRMQVTVDGYVAGPAGQLEWMTFDMDSGLLAFINRLTDTSDTILLGRKMTDGFVKYWEHVVTQKDSPEHDFAQKMVGLPKVVFSKTLQHIEGKNVRVENGDLVDAVKQLKNRAGKDIVVYGGATFVSSLIEHGVAYDFERPPGVQSLLWDERGPRGTCQPQPLTRRRLGSNLPSGMDSESSIPSAK